MAPGDRLPPPDPLVGPAPLFERGLGDRLDPLILWLQRTRARPWLSTGAALAVVAVVAVGWWLGRPSSAGPVEDRIPYAPGVITPGTDPAGPTGSSPTGAAGPNGPNGGPAPNPGVGPAAAATVGTGSSPGGPGVTEPPELVVHVAGAVTAPGIVRLKAGARVIDAMEAAGGPTAEADLDQLNLAAPVSDGLQIRVPRQGEIAPSPTGVAPQPPPGGSGVIGPASPVDLNGATAAELDSLPGIGPALATAIVTWRTENGRFATIDDLLEVPGIGPAKLEALADRVTV